jgi:hypothetical protein
MKIKIASLQKPAGSVFFLGWRTKIKNPATGAGYQYYLKLSNLLFFFSLYLVYQ